MPPHSCRAPNISDAAANGRKFSGDAQRQRKHYILFHGTQLHQMNLTLISRNLHEPAKQPDSRAKRTHCQFMDSLHATTADLRNALARAWQATFRNREYPADPVRLLVETKYMRDAWKLQLEAKTCFGIPLLCAYRPLLSALITVS